jgi:predicted enzyme involved in methoxymalonyl-ACP biosynthesis
VASETETFLQQANAEITVDFEIGAQDGRVLELVNKANQFNLNGVRCTPA